MCNDCCDGEFRRQNWILGHREPHLFVTSQWRNCACSPIFYVLYRLAVAVTFVALLALMIRDIGVESLMYLSVLAFLVITLDVVFQFFLALDGYVKFRKNNGRWEGIHTGMRWFLKKAWIHNNIATGVNLVSVVWSWIFYVESFEQLGLHGISTHVTVIVYIMFNHLMSAMPVRLFHFLHTSLFLLAYCIFTVIWQVQYQNPPLYELFDWVQNPGESVGWCLLFVLGATFIVWLIYFILYRIKLAIFHGCTEGQYQTPAYISNTHGKTQINIKPAGVTTVTSASSNDGWVVAHGSASSSATNIDHHHVTTTLNHIPAAATHIQAPMMTTHIPAATYHAPAPVHHSNLYPSLPGAGPCTYGCGTPTYGGMYGAATAQAGGFAHYNMVNRI